jgi:hypothetical protein
MGSVNLKSAAEVDAEQLAAAKTKKATEIDAEHAACLTRGVEWNNTRWTATNASRDTLFELIEVADAEGGPVAILDARSARHDLSLAELNDLRAAGRQHRTYARLRRLELHGQVQAATHTSELPSDIDIQSGWPG